MIKKSALVENVYLEYQERHILNVNCFVSYEDFGSQNIMNIVLDTWDKEKQKRVGTAEGMTFLIDLLDFFGVNNLTEVKNQYIYVLVDEAYRDWETDRKSTRLNSSHRSLSRMPSSA